MIDGAPTDAEVDKMLPGVPFRRETDKEQRKGILLLSVVSVRGYRRGQAVRVDGEQYVVREIGNREIVLRRMSWARHVLWPALKAAAMRVRASLKRTDRSFRKAWGRRVQNGLFS